jgi:ribonuclease HI
MRAEMMAIRLALRELLEKGGEEEADRIAVPRGAEVRLATDSQSAIRALQAGAGRQRTILGQQIWSALRAVSGRLQVHVTLVYCPGHVQIAGNEAADAEAKAAAQDAPEDPSEDPTPIPFGVAATILKRHFRQQQAAEVVRDRVEKDGHWAKVCRDGPPKWREHEGMTRAEQRILAQFRAGKCSLLADYRHMCGWEKSPACDCGAPVQSVEHVVLECPIHVPARNGLIAPPMKADLGLEILARFPERAVRFLRDAKLNFFPKRENEPKALPPEEAPAQTNVVRGWATRRANAAAAAAAAPAPRTNAVAGLSGPAYRAARERKAEQADRAGAP